MFDDRILIFITIIHSRNCQLSIRNDVQDHPVTWGTCSCQFATGKKRSCKKDHIFVFFKKRKKIPK